MFSFLKIQKSPLISLKNNRKNFDENYKIHYLVGQKLLDSIVCQDHILSSFTSKIVQNKKNNDIFQTFIAIYFSSFRYSSPFDKWYCQLYETFMFITTKNEYVTEHFTSRNGLSYIRSFNESWIVLVCKQRMSTSEYYS